MLALGNRPKNEEFGCSLGRLTGPGVLQGGHNVTGQSVMTKVNFSQKGQVEPESRRPEGLARELGWGETPANGKPGLSVKPIALRAEGRWLFPTRSSPPRLKLTGFGSRQAVWGPRCMGPLGSWEGGGHEAK